MRALAGVLTTASLLCLVAISPPLKAQDQTSEDQGGPMERSQIIRPGLAFVPERSVGSSGRGGTCTLAFLVTDGSDIYALTAGHCYANVSQHPTQKGFMDYKSSLNKSFDDAYSAVDCDALRLCEGKRIGKFVFALNNVYGDPVDSSGPLGTYNDELKESGDVALIRLHEGVPYNPGTCLYGGPLGLYTRDHKFHTEPVEGRAYGQGAVVGANGQLGAINGGYPVVAWPGNTPWPWWDNDLYSFTIVTTNADIGASGGPLQTADGHALGVMGDPHYSARVSTNLERIGSYLGKTLTLLTTSLNKDMPVVGVDKRCIPPARTATQ